MYFTLVVSAATLAALLSGDWLNARG
jgi:hypothetical protein